MAELRHNSDSAATAPHRRQQSVASTNDVLDTLGYYAHDDMELSGGEGLQPPNVGESNPFEYISASG